MMSNITQIKMHTMKTLLDFHSKRGGKLVYDYITQNCNIYYLNCKDSNPNQIFEYAEQNKLEICKIYNYLGAKVEISESTLKLYDENTSWTKYCNPFYYYINGLKKQQPIGLSITTDIKMEKEN
jgi:hypothetical protein